MERSVVSIIISTVLLGIVVGSTAATQNATAYWVYYEPYNIDWDLNKAGVACAPYDADKPREWRSQHYWAALCGKNGPSFPASCGQCLRVSNSNPKQKYSVVVRIVDDCDSERIDLEETAFDLIDYRREGKMAGYLHVNYEVVNCNPPPPPPPPPSPPPPPPSPPPPPPPPSPPPPPPPSPPPPSPPPPPPPSPPPPPPSPPPPPPPSPPPPPAGPGETNVIAYWSDYQVEKYNWSYRGAACAALDGGKPLEWRQRYGWTGYCGKVLGPELKDICGQCLKVANTRTKDEKIVRVVDTCGSGGLELDLDTAFRPIDTDGQGYADGHLVVDYQVVQCEDEVDSPLGLYSQ